MSQKCNIPALIQLKWKVVYQDITKTCESQNEVIKSCQYLSIFIEKLRHFKLFFRRKATPVKNTENVEGAVRKEDQNAAVMSYATLNDGNSYGMPNHTNIYENIHEDNMYDAPYEETSHHHHHYEPTPISRGTMRPMVTINGVAVR